MTTPKTTKPGFKTSEFWLTLMAELVGFVMISGVMENGEASIWSKIVGGLVAVLAALGYTASRGKAKSNGS